MLWLIGQILFCLLIAGLLGLLLGWLLWGLRTHPEPVVQTDTAALDRANTRISQLERELAAWHTKVSAPAAADSVATAAAAYGLFGPVSETTVDDLKRISGIGAVIEKQLAGIGVTTYRQIATFNADDILRVQEAIDFFPGRIEREDWVAQAARLHREKYGTEPEAHG